jgi:hypothetical protein
VEDEVVSVVVVEVVNVALDEVLVAHAVVVADREVDTQMRMVLS